MPHAYPLIQTTVRILERHVVSLLAISIAISGALYLYLGRGGFFTTDELGLVAKATEPLTLENLLSPLWGHLLAVPRLSYRALLEVFGGGYVLFQILALVANSAVVVLLFYYMRRFIRPIVALGACLVLLIFGLERLDIFSGNGFLVKGPVALGLGAVLLTWKHQTVWNAVACVLLVLGVLSFSIVLVFIIYILAWLLLERRYRSLWVGLIPLFLYLAWRIYLGVADVGVSASDIGAQGINLKNLLLWPVWSLNALSAILSSVTGLTYLFGGSELPRVGNQVWGSVLVVGFIILLWQAVKRSWNPDLISGILALAFLFLLQALAWIPEVRGPDASRYQGYGAVVMFMVLAATLGSLARSREREGLLLALLLCGISVNAVLFIESGAVFREESLERRGDVTAAVLVSDSLGPKAENYLIPEGTIDPTNLALMASAERKFGGLTSSPGENPDSSLGGRIDFVLVNLLGFEAKEAGRSNQGLSCEVLRAADAKGFLLGERAPRIRVRAPAELLLRKYGPSPGLRVSSLEAGRSVTLDVSAQKLNGWKATIVGADATVCR